MTTAEKDMNLTLMAKNWIDESNKNQSIDDMTIPNRELFAAEISKVDISWLSEALSPDNKRFDEILKIFIAIFGEYNTESNKLKLLGNLQDAVRSYIDTCTSRLIESNFAPHDGSDK